MKLHNVQTLVMRAHPGPAVAHVIACIPDHCGRRAAALLKTHEASYGLEGETSMCRSVGFSFAGLEALRVPTSYLSLFRRLAPAFAAGAVQRSVDLGDGGASGAAHWSAAFRQDRAHVVLTWHGDLLDVQKAANDFKATWYDTFRKELENTLSGDGTASPFGEPEILTGARLDAPPGKEGQWVHFGFRDGISEIRIEDTPAQPIAPDSRKYVPGTLILGDVNHAGFNLFALSHAPDKVIKFFHDSSFGILRPMLQDLEAFEQAIRRWMAEMAPTIGDRATRDFVKAKLCGRWPDGTVLRPGEFTPGNASLVLDLAGDAAGEGCPFGSHVRRMRAAPDRYGGIYERPLQRRSFPFGPAAWSERPDDQEPRGHLGHFFCANIEDQFEHLLGQWAARAPLGCSRGDTAQDPLDGPHDDPDAALKVPLQGFDTQWLSGFRPWTTTLGTMYAWHPGKVGWEALMTEDFVPKEDEGPWL